MNQKGAGQPWSVAFRREREAAWRELDSLVAQAERGGLRAVPSAQLARLPVLYRAATSALSVARASVLDRNLLDYLESLVARAYLVVYAPKRSALAVAVQFFGEGLPRAVRQIRWHLLASAVAMLLGTAVAWVLTARDMDLYYLFIDSGMAQGRDPLATTEELRQTLFADGEHSGGGLLAFASFLFAHNAGIGILTFGLGFLAGVPVLLMMFMNGMLLGAMAALFTSRGLGVEFWSWILPHGVTELLAIVLCGAAGLAIADRLVFPGRFPRLYELARTGRRMGGVVGGAVAMLFVAGLVEGVFRQVVTYVPGRYLLAALFAAGWAVYFGLVGRRRR